MSTKEFTEAEIHTLSKNIYIKKVSAKGITYSDEFKHIFIDESEKGKTSRTIFCEYGFDTNMLGRDRYASAAKRWRNNYKRNGLLGLKDTRECNSGRPIERDLSIEEKYNRVKAQNNLLKAENELLKKIHLAERRLAKEK